LVNLPKNDEPVNHSKSLPELPELSKCADEKIHIPGNIQPHGVLLALTEPDLTIVQASESVSSAFGICSQALIDQPLSILIGKP